VNGAGMRQSQAISEISLAGDGMILHIWQQQAMFNLLLTVLKLMVSDVPPIYIRMKI
jgi:hypothetical protein